MVMKSLICLFSSNTVYSLALAMFLIITGCSDSGSSGVVGTPVVSTPSVDSGTASLGNDVKNVPLVSGAESKIKFTFTVPGDISAKGDPSINVSKSLQHITLSTSPITKNSSRFESLRLLANALVKQAFAASPAQVTAHISHAGDPDVCSSAFKYGPYTINGMIGEALTSDTENIPLTQPTVDIVNSGSFEICVITTPLIDAFLTVTDVDVDFGPCEESTLDIVSYWGGTFQCTPFGGTPGPVDDITLQITLNADGSYHYTDFEADYDGHLCDNKLKFSGGLAGDYNESGTLIFSSDSTATKTSTYTNIAGTGGGTCSDTLEKLVN
jgi:hypothetical protein